MELDESLAQLRARARVYPGGSTTEAIGVVLAEVGSLRAAVIEYRAAVERLRALVEESTHEAQPLTGYVRASRVLTLLPPACPPSTPWRD